MKISTVAVGSTFAVCVATAAHGAPVAIAEMSITAGSFFDNNYILSSPIPFDVIGPNTNLVGGYIGNGGLGRAAGDPDPDRIAGFEYALPLPVNIYTAAANLGDTNTHAGTLAGGPVPSGVVDAATGTITLDLSSWFVNDNDFDFNEGHAAATGTWDAGTHSYSLTWDVTVPGDVAITHTWTLEGLAHPVPEPSGVLLVVAAVGVLAARCRLQVRDESRRQADPDILSYGGVCDEMD
jgi:hypothetical protein